MEALVTTLGAWQRVEVASIEPLSGGYDAWAESWRAETGDGPLVVRLDRGVSCRTATWISEVIERAAEAGVPCRPPLPGADGLLAFALGDATMTVHRFVDGSMLDRDDPVQLNAAGSTLARMHTALSGRRPSRPEPSPWDPSLWPADHDSPALRDAKLDAWHARLIAHGGRGLRRGIIHGDYWAGNLVWDAGWVASVLDWSEARVDLLARELAWSTFEFGNDGTNLRLDADRARTFLAGYRAVAGPWEAGLAEVLVPLMRVEVRAHARYSLGDPGDIEYNLALQHAFADLADETAGALLDR